MVSRLLELARVSPDRLLVADHDVDGTSTSQTREQFNRRVNRFVSVLSGLGIRPGGTIAVMADNAIDYVTVLVGASLSNVSQVPVNWHLTADEVAFILESSDVALLVTDVRHEEIARTAAHRAGTSHLLVLGDEFERALAAASDEEPETRPTASAIFYTAGTTGRPKATRMAEMRNGVAVEEVVAAARDVGGAEDHVNLTMGPLYHGGPLMGAVRSVLLGAELHIMRRFDPELALRVISSHGVTNTTGVPTHFVRMLQLPEHVRNDYDVSSLRRVHHIGAIMPPEVKDRMIDWWGPVLVDAYGCSELGTITRITTDEWLERRGSVGRPLPEFSLHIRDEDGTELPPGQVGVIWIESHGDADIVYLGDPERTASCHRSAKEFTLFDVGFVDDGGYLYLVDRRVDQIISGGVNIYPAEVESVLIMHPDVVDVGVFAIPDAEWGHAVKAAVLLRDEASTHPAKEREILDWAAERMARYKLPRSIDFVEALPRTTAGKIQRRRLRAPYWPADAG